MPHASTRNVARDLDLVRAALGERRISYLGWSYGGYLGAVYARLFPHRVARMVLDSAPDPQTYGPDGERDHYAAQAAEQENWVAWEARRRGTTPAAVRATVDAIREVADRHGTLTIGRHTVDPNLVRRLALGTDTEELYGRWSDLLALFAAAARGEPVTPGPQWEPFFESLSSREVDAGASAFAASLCADRAAYSRGPEAYFRDIRAHRVSEPMYGPVNRNVTPCTFWPTAPAEPPTRVGGALPALLVGATGDPSTPYAGQQVLHGALRGSRMVSLHGAFRHGVYSWDANPCVDGVVVAYLLGGRLPASDVTCTRSSPTGPTGPGGS
ncbi:hypothetical protein Val02_72070 [Virgisporangium aliadipatigenens]|uniref:Peptidase S33 tripeptidyl aminopeptidase-like C-terminal domain-containing protein n=1 Tax=Virgisporangium aliadipatigenens TaxID=741659 RepID=A0A8J4DUG2_9ACTN|nr:hypothetical protein Val02_72070 [Virgisporangium aliadipatigenens]